MPASANPDSRAIERRLPWLAAEALSEYDLQPTLVTPLRRSDNAMFRVTTAEGERYALRLYRQSGNPWHPVRTASEVASEMAWLAALRRDTDLVVPEPAPNRGGSLLTFVTVAGRPEARICVLLRWVEGRFRNAGLTPRQMERVGAFMARLHEHALAFSPPEGFVRHRVGDTSPEITSFVLETVAELCGDEAAVTAELVIERARATQRELGEAPHAFTLIHGDLHQENYLFHQGEVRAIDFDDCGWGHLMWDFAVTLSEVKFFPNYQDLRAAMLRGYQQARPLPADFERHLEPLMALRLLQLTLWFLEMREHPAFSDWEDEVRDLLAELNEDVRRGFLPRVPSLPGRSPR